MTLMKLWDCFLLSAFLLRVSRYVQSHHELDLKRPDQDSLTRPSQHKQGNYIFKYSCNSWEETKPKLVFCVWSQLSFPYRESPFYTLLSPYGSVLHASNIINKFSQLSSPNYTYLGIIFLQMCSSSYLSCSSQITWYNLIPLFILGSYPMIFSIKTTFKEFWWQES